MRVLSKSSDNVPLKCLSTGVEVKFKGAFYSVLISPTLVPELNQLELTEDGLIVGAAITLSKLNTKLKELLASLPKQKTRTFAALLEMLRWFAGQQIRNVAVSRLILVMYTCCVLITIICGCSDVVQGQKETRAYKAHTPV